VDVPTGGSVALVDAAGHPAVQVTVPGEGTYAVDASTGAITFAPDPGFTGQASGVTYELVDVYGKSVQARYVPTVVAAPAAPEPVAPLPELPVPTGPVPTASPSPPATTPVAPPARPRTAASVDSPRLGVTPATGRGASVGLTCALDSADIGSCAIVVTARVGRRDVVVGRGHATARPGTRRLVVRTVLTPLGRALTRRLGGTRLRVRAEVLPRGADAPVRANGATRVVARSVLLPRPVFFDTASARIRAAERRYLARLRHQLDGAAGVACTGYTDDRSTGAYNHGLGLARARAVCAALARGRRIGAFEVTRGEGRPFAANTTAHGRQLNRRVEIRVRYSARR
jgi:CshA-type fibril repeat protein